MVKQLNINFVLSNVKGTLVIDSLLIYLIPNTN